MRIALVTDVIYPYTIGGSEMHNYEVGRRLAARGHEVHIFGGKFWDGADVIEQEGMTLHGLTSYSRLYDPDGMRSAREPLLLARRVFGELWRSDFDVIDVLAFVFPACYSAWLAALMSRTPLVITWQQYFSSYLFDYFGYMKGFIARALERGSLYLTRYHLVVSEHVKSELVRRGVPEKNITLIPNGVDTERVAAATPANVSWDVIFVGRLHYQKNPQLLLEAVAHACRTHPGRRVSLIGDGPEFSRLKKLTQELRISENVTFLGEIKDRDELYRHLKASKLFVLPSRLEGFPLTILEAQAAGLPVITTRTQWNDTSEYINDGENGWCISPKASDLAHQIGVALHSTNHLQWMSAISPQYARTFTWSRICDMAEYFYAAVSSSSRGFLKTHRLSSAGESERERRAARVA
jgi:glycosyltransferase involved in cell wall biosynthesis